MMLWFVISCSIISKFFLLKPVFSITFAAQNSVSANYIDSWFANVLLNLRENIEFLGFILPTIDDVRPVRPDTRSSNIAELYC